jgi:ribonuclease HI
METALDPERTLAEGKVVIYTDGACEGNPGPGGYGVVLRYKDQRKELSGGYRLTTNNRMELAACIAALEALKRRSEVVLFSDSQYVVNGVALGWAARWRAHGWMRNKKEKVENTDLWARLLELFERHDAQFIWLRGHAGNVENERCDYLSVQALRRSDLPVDKVYEGKL